MGVPSRPERFFRCVEPKTEVTIGPIRIFLANTRHKVCHLAVCEQQQVRLPEFGRSLLTTWTGCELTNQDKEISFRRNIKPL